MKTLKEIAVNQMVSPRPGIKVSFYFDFHQDNYHFILPMDTTKQRVAAMLIETGRRILNTKD